MSNTKSTFKSSDRKPKHRDRLINHIGKIFTIYGESYIKQYQPDIQKIKLIRARRICKSPMLGGRAIVCTSCQNHHYVYNSCGHSHCPICQSIKREQWNDKLKNNLLNVPYIHMIFTLPHQLNGLARANKKIIYSLILKTSWAVVKNLSKTNDNIGGLPGMVSVLHTFGSDMKYHIDTHNLVTFGALELENNIWKKPKRKDKIARYRQINSLYKKLFLQALKQQYLEGKITYYMNYQQVEEMVKNITSVVHNTKPTLDTKFFRRLPRSIY